VKRVPTTAIDDRVDDTVAMIAELRQRWLPTLGSFA
jgi:hypothetical protein